MSFIKLEIDMLLITKMLGGAEDGIPVGQIGVLVHGRSELQRVKAAVQVGGRTIP